VLHKSALIGKPTLPLAALCCHCGMLLYRYYVAIAVLCNVLRLSDFSRSTLGLHIQHSKRNHKFVEHVAVYGCDCMHLLCWCEIMSVRVRVAPLDSVLFR
jgi:hypothetical protein